MKNQGWDKVDAIVYLDAYYANLALPAQQIYLRIPGAADYSDFVGTRPRTEQGSE